MSGVNETPSCPGDLGGTSFALQAFVVRETVSHPSAKFAVSSMMPASYFEGAHNEGCSTPLLVPKTGVEKVPQTGPNPFLSLRTSVWDRRP